MILIFERNVNAYLLALILSASGLLSGCDPFKNEPVLTAAHPDKVKLNGEALLSAANLYAYTQMAEALNQAQILDGIITSFLHHPNPLSLEETQAAWVSAYQAFLKVSYFHVVFLALKNLSTKMKMTLIGSYMSNSIAGRLKRATSITCPCIHSVASSTT